MLIGYLMAIKTFDGKFMHIVLPLIKKYLWNVMAFSWPLFFCHQRKIVIVVFNKILMFTQNIPGVPPGRLYTAGLGKTAARG